MPLKGLLEPSMLFFPGPFNLPLSYLISQFLLLLQTSNTSLQFVAFSIDLTCCFMERIETLRWAQLWAPTTYTHDLPGPVPSTFLSVLRSYCPLCLIPLIPVAWSRTSSELFSPSAKLLQGSEWHDTGVALILLQFIVQILHIYVTHKMFLPKLLKLNIN